MFAVLTLFCMWGGKGFRHLIHLIMRIYLQTCQWSVNSSWSITVIIKKLVFYVSPFNSDGPLKSDASKFSPFFHFSSFHLNCSKTDLVTDLPMVCKFNFVRYGDLKKEYCSFCLGLILTASKVRSAPFQKADVFIFELCVQNLCWL